MSTTTLGGHTHIDSDGYQFVCNNRSCGADTVGAAKTTEDTDVSQACRVYGDHRNCPGENTLGTTRCQCACHRGAP
jgi:hypothetical protein